MNWLHEIEDYKEDFIKDLRGVLRIPSVRDDASASADAPFGKSCKEALDYMLALAEEEGFSTQNIDGYAGVITYGEGEESIGVLGHLDIVPIGEGWTKDPYAGEIVDGYMFGRGTVDDKGPGMAGFYALKMLRDKGIKLNKKIMLIYGCDEESGMECMDYYVNHAEVPSCGFVPDADFPVIYGEKGGLHITLKGKRDTVIASMHAGERPNIVIGKASAIVHAWEERSLDLFDFYLKTNQLEGSVVYTGTQVEISIEGTFSHAAWPYNGNNAALHLLNFIGKTYDDKFANDTYEMLNDWQGKPLGIQKEGVYMGFLTMSTGIVDIEDGEISILVDVRYPNDCDTNAILEGFQKKANELDYGLEIAIAKNSKPLFVDPNSKLVTTLMDVYREYTNDNFTPALTIGGGTYARKFPNFVAYGPELPNRVHPEGLFIGGPHQKDEAVNVDDLLMSVAIYTAAIEKLAK